MRGECLTNFRSFAFLSTLPYSRAVRSHFASSACTVNVFRVISASWHGSFVLPVGFGITRLHGTEHQFVFWCHYLAFAHHKRSVDRHVASIDPDAEGFPVSMRDSLGHERPALTRSYHARALQTRNHTCKGVLPVVRRTGSLYGSPLPLGQHRASDISQPFNHASISIRRAPAESPEHRRYLVGNIEAFDFVRRKGRPRSLRRKGSHLDSGACVYARLV